MIIAMASIATQLYIVDGTLFGEIPVRAHVRAASAREAALLVRREAGPDFAVVDVNPEWHEMMGNAAE